MAGFGSAVESAQHDVYMMISPKGKQVFQGSLRRLDGDRLCNPQGRTQVGNSHMQKLMP